jgi:hypothetical protein
MQKRRKLHLSLVIPLVPIAAVGVAAIFDVYGAKERAADSSYGIGAKLTFS